MSESAKDWESSLNEGEQLKWTGKTSACGVVDPDNKGTIYLKFAVGVIWIAASLIFYLPKNADVISFIIIDIVPFFLLLLPFTNANTIRKAKYAITDKRVLVNLGGQVYSMDYDATTEVKKRDNGTVLVGAAAAIAPSKDRHTLLYRGIMDSEKNVLGVVLYSPDDPDGACKALETSKALAA